MNKTILATGALLGILAVILGAFGAHGLKTMLPAEALQSFETGVKYQMYHALLLLFTGSTAYLGTGRKKVIYTLILTGVVLFSGSVYGLATNTLTSFDFTSIAFVTPVGGMLLIAAWGVLFWSFINLKRQTGMSKKS